MFYIYDEKTINSFCIYFDFHKILEVVDIFVTMTVEEYVNGENFSNGHTRNWYLPILIQPPS